jgi:hypothetical protein
MLHYHNLFTVQISHFRPNPNHNATDSQLFRLTVKAFSRSALAGEPSAHVLPFMQRTAVHRILLRITRAEICNILQSGSSWPSLIRNECNTHGGYLDTRTSEYCCNCTVPRSVLLGDQMGGVCSTYGEKITVNSVLLGIHEGKRSVTDLEVDGG